MNGAGNIIHWSSPLRTLNACNFNMMGLYVVRRRGHLLHAAQLDALPQPLFEPWLKTKESLYPGNRCTSRCITSFAVALKGEFAKHSSLRMSWGCNRRTEDIIQPSFCRSKSGIRRFIMNIENLVAHLAIQTDVRSTRKSLLTVPITATSTHTRLRTC